MLLKYLVYEDRKHTLEMPLWGPKTNPELHHEGPQPQPEQTCTLTTGCKRQGLYSNVDIRRIMRWRTVHIW